MHGKRLLPALLLLSVPLLAQTNLKHKAGSLLDVPFYWDNQGFSADTLSSAKVTRLVGKSSEEMKPFTFHAFRRAAEEAGKTIYELKDCNGISAAILNDLGYPVVLATQWSSLTDYEIKVSSPGMDDEYKQRRLITDLVYETLDTFDIQKPSKLQENYTVALHFSRGGRAEYEGKEGITAKAQPYITPGSGLVISLDRAANHEDQDVQKRIWEAYLLVDGKKKPSKIIGEIESVMDDLGLDLSYKPPQMVSLEK